MTTYHWADLYNQAVTNFGGERPGAQIEQRILETFERNPQAVKDAIAQVSKQYTAGKITSGWAVLAKHLDTHTGPTADRTANDQTQRAKRITQAETWIRNAGIHYDTASEVEDELFGDRGTLKDWPDLRERFLQLWKQARPIGEQLEQDLHDRSEHWKATTGVLWNERNRRRLEQATAQTTQELITETLDDAEIARSRQQIAAGQYTEFKTSGDLDALLPTDDLPAELQPQETT